MRRARRLAGVYWLELAGEADAFTACEATTAATDVRLRAPGIADATSLEAGVDGLAYTRYVNEVITQSAPSVDAAVTALAAASLSRTGSAAVRARNVRNTTDVSTAAAERALGAVLVDRGFDIDLEHPDHVLRASFAAGRRVEHDAVAGADGERAALCALGWVETEPSRAFAPAPTDRPFFQPGSMSPADARACVNLAGAAPGRTLLDPMCGTGGLPMEAGLVGADVLAGDAQQKMVAGTRTNLDAVFDHAAFDHAAFDDAGASNSAQRDGQSWAVFQSDATRLPVTAGAVDGVVFDAPYGRQSKIARHELADLVAGALTEAARVAPRAVVIADRDWQATARTAGWEVAAAFERRVHRSLTRYVMVLTRAGGSGPGSVSGSGSEPGSGPRPGSASSE